MRLRWVNHASFVLDYGDVHLISDPWLFGTAFADSWDLLSPTVFSPDDFATITHIWLSHEHPDHFSPPSLRSIPEADRARIVVMTQRTRDRRVASYCRGLGFADVIELPSATWFDLGSDVQVMCQPVKLDDSWLAIRAGDQTVLNLNDCLLSEESEVRVALEEVGRPIDLLLTQFSYAAWAGNESDVDSYLRSAAISRERMLMQTRVVAPRWVIPFASYVWFSHEENAHMNAHVNRVEDIVNDARRTTTSTPIVMYPGDEWIPGQGDDPTPSALERYVADRLSIGTRPLHGSKPHAIEELQILAAGYSRQLLRFHGPALRLIVGARQLPPTPIWLKDQSRTVMLSIGGLTVSSLAAGQCDIAMTSDALAYVLGQMWGGMTLIISGRFDVPSGGDLDIGGPPRRFQRFVELADNVNHGWRVSDEVRFRLRNWLPLLPRIDWLVRHTPDSDRPPAA